MPVRMRIRAPSGQETLQGEDTWTVNDLVIAITEKTGVQDFDLKAGFPPTRIDLTLRGRSILDLNLNGSTLTLEPKGDTTASQQAAAPSVPQQAAPAFTPSRPQVDETVVEWEEVGGYLALRVMADDNSCMFTAFGGVLQLPNPASELRKRVAEHILAHPAKYTKVVLEGLEPAEYASRIRDPQRWGGSIELTCLSEIFDIQICSVDVKSGRIDTYGEDKSIRCLLLYSGIHYDRIVQTFDLGAPSDADVVQWPSDDDAVLVKARELAAKLKSANYFTDTHDMAIRCDMPGCENWLGAGAGDMAKHTKATGHNAFSELDLRD